MSKNIAIQCYQWIISSPIDEAYELECYHLMRLNDYELLNWWGLKLRYDLVSNKQRDSVRQMDY